MQYVRIAGGNIYCFDDRIEDVIHNLIICRLSCSPSFSNNKFKEFTDRASPWALVSTPVESADDPWVLPHNRRDLRCFSMFERDFRLLVACFEAVLSNTCYDLATP